MKETDQRVLKTRRQLKEAFIMLVISNGFAGTTIRDITKRAGVGYRTFFRHYKDANELWQDIMGEFIDEVGMLFDPPGDAATAEANLITLFRETGRRADFFRAMFRAPDWEARFKPLIDFGRKSGKRSFPQNELPEDVVITHFVFSVLTLQKWWLDQNMQPEPEVMAQYANRLVIQPLRALAEKPLPEG